MAYEIRPMSLGEILDAGFRLLRDHFATLFGLAALVYVPLGLLELVVSLETADASGSPVATIVAGVLYLLVLSVGLPLIAAAITLALGAVYLGRPLPARAALRRSWTKVMPLAGTSLLAYIFIGLGLLLLVVPGIWLAFAYFVTSQVVVLEDLSGRAALRRSSDLMKGWKGRGFLISLVAGVLQGVLVGAPAWALQAWPAVDALVGIVMSSLSLAFLLAVTVAFYFDLRCRRDGFDLEHLARQVEQAGAPAAVPAPAL